MSQLKNKFFPTYLDYLFASLGSPTFDPLNLLFKCQLVLTFSGTAWNESGKLWISSRVFAPLGLLKHLRMCWRKMRQEKMSSRFGLPKIWRNLSQQVWVPESDAIGHDEILYKVFFKKRCAQPGADVKNKSESSVTMQCWNKALWLALPSHITIFNQSEYFISEKCSFAILKFVKTLAPAPLFRSYVCPFLNTVTNII